MPITLRDPGPDGAFGNADDGAELPGVQPERRGAGGAGVNQLTNLDGKGEYQTVEFGVNKRQTGRWSLAALVLEAVERGPRDHLLRPEPPLGDDAVDAERPHQHRRRPVRVQHVDGQDQRQLRAPVVDPGHAGAALPVGTALRPDHPGPAAYGIGGTGGINYGSARILMEPIGTRTQDDIMIFDFRAEKYFNLGSSSRRFGVFFDVYNLTNSDAHQNITWNAGSAFELPSSDRPADHRALRHEVRLVASAGW